MNVRNGLGGLAKTIYTHKVVSWWIRENINSLGLQSRRSKISAKRNRNYTEISALPTAKVRIDPIEHISSDTERF